MTDDGGERGPKVACSIKLVDQREGTDLDPHNVKWQPRGEGGPGGHGFRGPAQAAAVVQQGQHCTPYHLSDSVDMPELTCNKSAACCRSKQSKVACSVHCCGTGAAQMI